LSQNKVTFQQNGRQSADVPDPEVVVQATRRRFTAQYKQRILEEADQCQEAGAIGALLRRKWRQQRAAGQVQGLGPKQRGRKPEPQAAELARLQRENERLQARLEQAETIIEVQKKLCRLLELPTAEMDENE
jgi:transposase-like protein